MLDRGWRLQLAIDPRVRGVRRIATIASFADVERTQQAGFSMERATALRTGLRSRGIAPNPMEPAGYTRALAQRKASLTRCRFSVLQDGSGSTLRRMDARPQRGRMRLQHGWPAMIEWLAIAATMGLGAAYSCDPDPQSDLDGRPCALEDTRLDRGDPLPRWSGHLCCLEHQTRDAALQ